MQTEPQQLELPVGAPCWMDLVTSDPDKTVPFYEALFGWKSQETAPEMQGYRYFQKDGRAVGGCMLNQAEWGTPDGWNIFLRTDDVRATASAAREHGGKVLMEPMDVGQNGSFVVVEDAGGAAISAWQAGTEKGFGALREEGAPVHFELHTRDYDKAVRFYQDVFGWEPHVLMDLPEFRYPTFSDEEDPKAGIMDASAFLPEGVAPYWSVYISVPDVDASLAKAVELGGTIIAAAESTPYGRLATLGDPTGAVFKLRG